MSCLFFYLEMMQKLRLDRISSINLENINKLAEEFRMHHEVLIPWLLECSNGLQLSKILFFLILLQSFMVPKLGNMLYLILLLTVNLYTTCIAGFVMLELLVLELCNIFFMSM